MGDDDIIAANETHRSDRMPLQRHRPSESIRPHGATPVDIPAGHVGPVFLPGSGRLIWWTGRVAIGLRHEPMPRRSEVSQSALWVQDLMLSGNRSFAAGH